MKEYIKVEYVSTGRYLVFFENGIKLGEFLCKEDGFFDFWPESRTGYWQAYIMREIANKLDEINAPYQAEIDRWFEEEHARNS